MVVVSVGFSLVVVALGPSLVVDVVSALLVEESLAVFVLEVVDVSVSCRTRIELNAWDSSAYVIAEIAKIKRNWLNLI